MKVFVGQPAAHTRNFGKTGAVKKDALKDSQLTTFLRSAKHRRLAHGADHNTELVQQSRRPLRKRTVNRLTRCAQNPGKIAAWMN